MTTALSLQPMAATIAASEATSVQGRRFSSHVRCARVARCKKSTQSRSVMVAIQPTLRLWSSHATKSIPASSASMVCRLSRWTMRKSVAATRPWVSTDSRCKGNAFSPKTRRLPSNTRLGRGRQNCACAPGSAHQKSNTPMSSTVHIPFQRAKGRGCCRMISRKIRSSAWKPPVRNGQLKTNAARASSPVPSAVFLVVGGGESDIGCSL